MRIVAAGDLQNITECYADGSSYASYSLRSGTLSTSLRFPSTAMLRVSALGDVRWAEPQGEDAGGMDAEYLVTVPGIGFDYKEVERGDWFERGLAISADYKVGVSLVGARPYSVFESRRTYSRSVFVDDNLLFGGRLLYGDAQGPLRSL